MREGLTIGLCGVGLAFTLIGAVGILGMPDVYRQIQCSSKTRPELAILRPGWRAEWRGRVAAAG